jgi:ABC-2 type transport system ATP-binding protein
VVIINKGRVVAEDTPENLTHRLKGSGAVHVELRGPAAAEAEEALRGVAGVAAARAKEQAGALSLELELLPGQDPRPELARCVVQKGWDLIGLGQAGMSLEDIFLHLTTSDEATGAAASTPEPAAEVNA